ncbi:MAG: hypothetical protein Q4G24_14465 [Paracoccus sp. (in: a-proteobacteria)]|nr:hypothetical protein [Paracoccus sp. (in: a-proteobacteria)]MDO5622660.1 hypothetical protein [Paracoccus sp. (in: a-proteobacteria)]
MVLIYELLAQIWLDAAGKACRFPWWGRLLAIAVPLALIAALPWLFRAH